MKFVLISGSVISGISKGICCSSIGSLLQASGFSVTAVKIDGYLNQSSGTINPNAHGEVAVLDNGSETDLDILNYERFLDITLTGDHSITAGKIYSSVFEKERQGRTLGETIQLVPHVSDEILQWIQRAAVIPVDTKKSTPEICMIELGGVITDLETGIFTEALAQLKYAVGSQNFFHVHVSLVPHVGEYKTKLVQNACKQLRALNLEPNIIICRTTHSEPLPLSIKEKISRFCFVPQPNIVENPNLPSIYHVPNLLYQAGVSKIVLNALQLVTKVGKPSLDLWEQMASIKINFPELPIAIVAKYEGVDCYLSIVRALEHASLRNQQNVKIVWINAETLTEANIDEQLKGCRGILVPGGFGVRGTEGKILACKYARQNNIPFLGLCLGFQLCIIQIARDLCGIWDATSEEFDEKAKNKVIVHMPEIDVQTKACNMRLGAKTTVLKPSTLAHKIYEQLSIDERHRHRYEFNIKYKEQLEGVGVIFSGADKETSTRMECLELKNHPFFFATQFHPEYKSRPAKPSPVFVKFVSAATTKTFS